MLSNKLNEQIVIQEYWNDLDKIKAVVKTGTDIDLLETFCAIVKFQIYCYNPACNKFW